MTQRRPARPHPHLYEISTWPWLDALSAREGRHVTLGTVPPKEWDRLGSFGFDLVYLMGVWRRSPMGRRFFRTHQPEFRHYDAALPGWQMRDVIGSPYSIQAYEPDPRIGTPDDLAAARRALQDRGMGLVLDFVPNHTGFDHRWIAEHPEYYVQGTEEDYKQNPAAFFLLERSLDDVLYIARGRDPYFEPWADVAQLNYFHPGLREAMVRQLEAIAGFCDGARCDMAMLVLNEIFDRTWRRYLRDTPVPDSEFWPAAVGRIPGFIWIAEVYWDLEWRLQQLGFGFTYDKRLYDRLHGQDAHGARAHLLADPDYQRRSVRFLENHDEPRSVATFGERRVAALATLIATLPGMRFFHDGQFEGRRVRLPVQLRRAVEEPRLPHLEAAYSRLLSVADEDVFHAGDWELLETTPAGADGWSQIVGYRWRLAGDLRVVAVNLGAGPAEAHLRLPGLDGSGRRLFLDQLTGQSYSWDAAVLERQGLYVRLDEGQSHIFKVTSE